MAINTVNASKNVPVTVAIPTYRRPELLLETLGKLAACDPQPAELILHVDGNDETSLQALRQSPYAETAKVLISQENVGPGGGRNKILAAAACDIVASLDDDSYPLDGDYFARLVELFDRLPRAAVIGAQIFHLDEAILPEGPGLRRVADFVNCGCAYRREAFLQTRGYLCLPLAYGMEEVDVALQLHHRDWDVYESDRLRILHNTRRAHQNVPKVTAASIGNQFLLAYLRYPAALWGLGFAQGLNRVRWLLTHGRRNGIGWGLTLAPQLIWQHRRQREAIAAAKVRSYLRLRRAPEAIEG